LESDVTWAIFCIGGVFLLPCLIIVLKAKGHRVCFICLCYSHMQTARRYVKDCID
jgi:hypothetical protein